MSDYPTPTGFTLNQVGDNAPTPEWLWRVIANYFYTHHHLGLVLDPCAGDGRLYNLLREPRDWCEIQLGKDYYDYEGAPDTIMTNPPWGARYNNILAKMLEDARRHLILLGPLRALIGTRPRAEMVRRAGFAARTLISLPPYSTTVGNPDDPDNFTRGGLRIMIVHWQRGYTGDIKELDWSRLTPSMGLNGLSESARPTKLSRADRLSYGRAMRDAYYLTVFAPMIRAIFEEVATSNFSTVLLELVEGDYPNPPNSIGWDAAKLRYHLRQCEELGIDLPIVARHRRR